MRRGTREEKKFEIKKALFTPIVLLFVLFSLFLFQYVPSLLGQKKSSSIIRPFTRQNTAADFEKIMAEKHIETESLYISSDSASITAVLKDGSRVFFSLAKDVEWQVSSLQEILTRLTIESMPASSSAISRKPSVIDLRFAKPIVKF